MCKSCFCFCLSCSIGRFFVLANHQLYRYSFFLNNLFFQIIHIVSLTSHKNHKKCKRKPVFGVLGEGALFLACELSFKCLPEINSLGSPQAGCQVASIIQLVRGWRERHHRPVEPDRVSQPSRIRQYFIGQQVKTFYIGQQVKIGFYRPAGQYSSSNNSFVSSSSVVHPTPACLPRSILPPCLHHPSPFLTCCHFLFLPLFFFSVCSTYSLNSSLFQSLLSVFVCLSVICWDFLKKSCCVCQFVPRFFAVPIVFPSLSLSLSVCL